MPRAYTEDQLVEQPAIGLFAELGWQAVSALDEALGKDGTLGREAPGEVVLASRLCAALERLNAALPLGAITAAVDELIRDRPLTLLEHAKCSALFDHVHENYQGESVSTHKTGAKRCGPKHKVKSNYFVNNFLLRGIPLNCIVKS